MTSLRRILTIQLLVFSAPLALPYWAKYPQRLDSLPRSWMVNRYLKTLFSSTISIFISVFPPR